MAGKKNTIYNRLGPVSFHTRVFDFREGGDLHHMPGGDFREDMVSLGDYGKGLLYL